MSVRVAVSVRAAFVQKEAVGAAMGVGEAGVQSRRWREVIMRDSTAMASGLLLAHECRPGNFREIHM